MSDLYERDFYGWANEQAALLRAGNLPAATFPAATFPAECPWSFDLALDDGFWPDATPWR